MKNAKQMIEEIIREELSVISNEKRDVVADRIVKDLGLRDVIYIHQSDLEEESNSVNVGVHSIKDSKNGGRTCTEKKDG